MLESAGVALVFTREEIESNAAREAWLEGGRPPHELAETLVNRYFSQFDAKSKKGGVAGNAATRHLYEQLS
jgi:hypothetical protein